MTDHSIAIHTQPSLDSNWRRSRNTRNCRLHSVRGDPKDYYWKHFPRLTRTSVTCCLINQGTSLGVRAWFLYADGQGLAKCPCQWQQQGRHPICDRRFARSATAQLIAKKTDNTIFRLCTNRARIQKLIDDLLNKKKNLYHDGLTDFL